MSVPDNAIAALLRRIYPTFELRDALAMTTRLRSGHAIPLSELEIDRLLTHITAERERVRERLLAVIPGGTHCDPQEVADALRARWSWRWGVAMFTTNQLVMVIEDQPIGPRDHQWNIVPPGTHAVVVDSTLHQSSDGDLLHVRLVKGPDIFISPNNLTPVTDLGKTIRVGNDLAQCLIAVDQCIADATAALTRAKALLQDARRLREKSR